MYTDIKINSNNSFNKLPVFIKNYILLTRADRPTGTLLLVMPCLWALALFKISPLQNFVFYLKVMGGAFCMRSAGCIINDILDRKFDAKVTRTQNRPLAAQSISLTGAFGWLVLHLLGALFVLLSFSPQTVAYGPLAVLMVGIYPLMKRWTYLAQFFLGFVFNLGVLFISIELFGTFVPAARYLYAAGVLWTVVYDTVYAFQDIADDQKLGLKSFAMLGPKYIKPVLSILIMLCVALLTKMLLMTTLPLGTLLVNIVLWGVMLANLWLVKLNTPSACLTFFKKAVPFGLMVFTNILLGHASFVKLFFYKIGTL